MIETEDIIKGCVAGKAEAQEALFKKYSKKMFGLCLRYTKDYSAAEDVLQDGFIKVLTNISSYKWKGSFEGWIRRIMINTALERYRKQFQMFSISDNQEINEKFISNEIIEDISAEDLLKLVQELPPAYKMVFNMYAIDGFSHKEVSEILNISIGTSKSNLSRARKILQLKVEKHFILPKEEQQKRC